MISTNFIKFSYEEPQDNTCTCKGRLLVQQWLISTISNKTMPHLILFVCCCEIVLRYWQLTLSRFDIDVNDDALYITWMPQVSPHHHFYKNIDPPDLLHYASPHRYSYLSILSSSSLADNKVKHPLTTMKQKMMRATDGESSVSV